MIEDSPFDSAHYGLRIGKLAIDRADELQPALAKARAAGYQLMFMRAEQPLAVALVAAGVTPIETLVISTMSRADLARAPAPPAGDPAVEVTHHELLSDATDVDAIAKLTAESFTWSHLHADHRLPVDATRRLYQDWARNDVTGRAYRTIVARFEGRVVGYITIVRHGPWPARIDLIAVTPKLQGRGIGSALMASYVDWVRRTPDLECFVGTQENNPVLKLYARFGFVRSQVLSEYHFWLDS